MQQIKLFYSYSHNDENDRDELEKRLSILKTNGLIDTWHDRKISAGDDWQEKINKEMEDSHIVLLLFSPDFIASQSCQDEITKSLELKKQGVIFIPIILRTCGWKDVEGISNVQALPQDGKPVYSFENIDDAWYGVYEGIKDKVSKLRENITPKLNDDFKISLLNNPIIDTTLDKLRYYVANAQRLHFTKRV